MKTWSDGYLTEMTYTHGYYPHLNPAMLRLACLCHGVEPPAAAPAYLELGFGQGVSVVVHAAASGGCFWGTDVNPAHVAAARRMGSASGADIRLLEDSFEELSRRTDLPDFDVIALHGVWSWVSDANREAIKDIIRRRLRPGGIAYISYNCLPGWAPAVPIRRLMRLYRDQDRAGHLGHAKTIEGALGFAVEVSRAGSAYFRDNPWARQLLESLGKEGPNYLAHEYLNADWHLEHFPDMVRSLDEAKLTFVGSARLLDGVDAIHLGDDGRGLLARIDDDVMREAVRDLLVNRLFRADIFVKGARKLSDPERREAWHDQAFVLAAPAVDIPKRIPCGRGEAELPADKYDPIIEALADENYTPKSLRDLLARPELRHRRSDDLVDALTILVGAGFASPAQVPPDGAVSRCQARNEHILQRARTSRDLDHLASPVTGGAIAVPYLDQLFLLATRDGAYDVDALANDAWSRLGKIDEGFVREGRPSGGNPGQEKLREAANRYLKFTRPHLEGLMAV